ncbi:hypothetical protein L596_009271 [Steinernema carpocapsae]|uniref:Protein kinase domain-containing protein n=1 Tax=Steinernema carpocapsae TaxID=34508 RepID=A0A4U5PFN4_STECR|nr:hypothetical protein L596_009271 [Steinernema carpocapsae]
MNSYITPFQAGEKLIVAGHHISIVRQIATDCRMYVYIVSDPEHPEQLILKECFRQPNFAEYAAENYGNGRMLNTGRWEYETQQDLQQHPNIVRTLGGHPWEKDRRRFLILMEYAPYGDLGQVLEKYGRVEYHTAWLFYEQILAAVGHMHREQQVHNGIAPRNIFIFDEGMAKVGDFGNGYVSCPCPVGQVMTHGERDDLKGAARCLVRMLLGNLHGLKDLQKVAVEEEIPGFLAEHPEWAGRMTAEDCWFIRQQFWSLYPRRPIPEAYGTPRSMM